MILIITFSLSILFITALSSFSVPMKFGLLSNQIFFTFPQQAIKWRSDNKQFTWEITCYFQMNYVCCHACKNYTFTFSLYISGLSMFFFESFTKIGPKKSVPVFWKGFSLTFNLPCGKLLMRGTCGFICSFFQYKQSSKIFLISPQQAGIQIFLGIGANVCSLPMWKFFSWHSLSPVVLQ